MQKTILSLATPQTLSYFETAFRGCQIRQCHSLESLKVFVKKPGPIFILSEFPVCTPRHVEALLAIKSENQDLKLMIYSKKIEPAVFQKFPRNNSLLLLSEDEKQKAGYLAGKFIQGQSVFVRSSERHAMNSPVLVKNTQWQALENSLPQKKGRFIDFAKLGAKIYVPQALFKVKDYISVLYQAQNQNWVTIECHTRWVESTPDGGQMLGIQFLAFA